MPTFDELRDQVRDAFTRTRENDLHARLHADHAELAKLLDELLGSRDYEPAMRDDIRDQIVVGATAHAVAEEEIVYDFLKQNASTRGNVEHAFREHAELDRLVVALQGMDTRDPGLEQVAEDLKRALQHHVHEEENVLLPRAEEAIGRDRLARLIPPFNSRRSQLQEELDRTEGWLDDPTSQTGAEKDRLGEAISQF